MAELAEPAVSFLLQSLSNFLIKEASHIGNVQNEAQLLESELRTMLALLKDAEPKQYQLSIIKNWISESRELAYEADDVLEGFAFKIGSMRSRGIANDFKRYACFLIEFYKRHKFFVEIQSLRTRVSNINKSFLGEGMVAIMLEKGGSSSSQQQLIRRTYSHLGEEEEEDFVGMESDVHILVNKLLNEDQKVVSIYGMGGLGKTTTAKHVYNNARVVRCFNNRVWVCISQQWKTEDILRRILIKLMPEKRKEIQEGTCEELVRMLSKFQHERKCLFVLDDMWKTDTWEAIKHAFSLRAMGSKILVTTRNKDVVEHIDPNGFHYPLKFLSEDESWELLRKKALRKRYQADDKEMEKMEELGRRMVKHCGGLPLAMVVLGGILATRSTLTEWELEYQNIQSGLGKEKNKKFEEVVQQILGLSYNDLSYQLKLCFLYLGAFPEDSEIDAEKICQQWLAEGFVANMDDAEYVLSELVVRCMVLIKIPNFAKAKRMRFESCRLHDLMHDLCLQKAKEENFMRIVKGFNDYKDGNKSLFDKFHRLFIDFDSKSVPASDQQIPIPKEMMLKHTRMLKVKLHGIEFPEIFRYKFKYLRVLTLEKMNADKYSKSTESKLSHVLGKLIHLRYLSVSCHRVDMLLSSLGNLIHLQTLHLLGFVNPLTPISLRNLRELKYLRLPFPKRKLFDCSCHGLKCLNPLQLDGLSELEILDNYNSCLIFDVGELLKLANLRVLTVREEYPEINNLERIVDYIYHSNSLQFVSIFIDGILESNKLPILLQKLLCARSLKKLYIEDLSYWFPKFEDSLSTSAAGILDLNITFYDFIDKSMSNPMETLENLPNLRELSLDQVGIDIEEMVSHATSFPQLQTLRLRRFNKLRKWNVEKGAFPRLRTLRLEDFYNMQSWVVEQGAMPNLSSLHLKSFYNLSELPERLLKMLKKVSYYQVSESLEKHIKAHLNELP